MPMQRVNRVPMRLVGRIRMRCIATLAVIGVRIARSGL